MVGQIDENRRLAYQTALFMVPFDKANARLPVTQLGREIVKQNARRPVKGGVPVAEGGFGRNRRKIRGKWGRNIGNDEKQHTKN